MAGYYLARLSLTLRSWAYWMNLSEEERELNGRELYWSYQKGGRTVAANFWCMINDGQMDMFDEYWDT